MKAINDLMKSNKYSWVILGCAVLCVAVLVYVLTGDSTASGISLAMAGVVGVPAPGTITTQEQQNLAGDTGWDVMSDIESKVTQLRPDIAPLDTMIRSMGSKPTDSYEVKWGESGFGEGFVKVEAQAMQANPGDNVTVKLDSDTFKHAVTSAV